MNEKTKKTTPEIVKILWYRHKVDKWPIKKISEVYNISKSTIYRWFKNIKDENINEDYIRFDIEKMGSEFFQDYVYFGENLLPREYFKSSFEVEPISDLTKTNELPSAYGFNYAFALPLDPYRIFIYWEIIDPDSEDSGIVIKVFDNTDNDVLLHMVLNSKYLVSNMYIPVGIPDRVYFAEIYRQKDNAFLVRTNRVRTPRNSPASMEIMNMYNWYNIDQTMFSISSFIINKL